MQFDVLVNGVTSTVDVAPDTPLLWVLRDAIGLTGTKYGCGIGLCGACTIHVAGAAVRSCQLTVDDLGTDPVTTIEGLTRNGDLHPVQQAWVDESVVQCGYCQSGQIMAAAALLEANSSPSDDEVAATMTGVLCRCGTYQRIRAAIARAAEEMPGT